MKKKVLIFFIAIIPIIVVAYYYCGKKKLDISDVHWVYEKGICTVSFIVRNNAKKQNTYKLSIRAYKQERISNAIVSKIVGEKLILVDVLAGERRKINEKLDLVLGLQPDMVGVSAWEDNWKKKEGSHLE